MIRTIGIAVVTLFLTAIAGTSYAYSTYLSTFLSAYPGTSGSELNTCGLCHVNPAGGGTRNSYGNDFSNTSIGNHSFNATLAARDSDGDGYSNLTEINARTLPSSATSHPTTTGGADTTPPTVVSFSIPSTSSSLTVSIASFVASDNVGVTGYLISQSSTRPSATSTAWSSFPPKSFSFSASGAQTLYAYAKDAAGNVSSGASAYVRISGSGSGGTGTGVSSITGVVKDIVTGTAISGAVVSDGSHTVTTGSSGVYTLNEAPGNYVLTIAKSGYLTTSQRASVAFGTASTVNWALTKSYGAQAIPAKNMNYVIMTWNDLGMHCDQDDYSYFGVLPPFNTLHAQIFRRGSEGADLITSGITVR
ncbi:MAG TPA: carboxypeptidase regulatory-like domain-containing protein [Dissulfurispiraceae bacterium]|nr:carboxypeptidase regulatory-like domain-containing protein [Dissulfurispiraceae bacterium]